MELIASSDFQIQFWASITVVVGFILWFDKEEHGMIAAIVAVYGVNMVLRHTDVVFLGLDKGGVWLTSLIILYFIYFYFRHIYKR